MATLRAWFRKFNDATGETPTHVVFGADECEWPGGYWEEIQGLQHEILTWPDVPAEILDRDFYDDFGGCESPNVCAWSPSWVIFSDNYDGAEELRWVPRSPTAHKPIRPGGG